MITSQGLKTIIVSALQGLIGLYKFPDGTYSVAVAVLPDEIYGFEYPPPEVEVSGVEIVIIAPEIKTTQLLSNDIRKRYTWSIHLKDWDAYGASLDRCLDLLTDAFQDAELSFNSPVKVQGSESLRILASAVIQVTEDYARIPGESPPPLVLPMVVSLGGTYFAGTEGQTVAVPIIRTGDLSQPVEVVVEITDLTAEPGDYEVDSLRILIPAYLNQAPLLVELQDDAEEEASETLQVRIASVSAGSIGTPNTCTVEISDYLDPAGTFSLSTIAYSIAEGAEVEIVVQRTLTQGAVTVSLELIDQTAELGVDFLQPEYEVEFLDGMTTGSVLIPTVLRAGGQGDRTFGVRIEGVSAGVIGSPQVATVTILEIEVLPDPAPGTFGFLLPAISVVENNGNLSLNLLRMGGADGEAVLAFSYSNDDATAGVDFLPTTILEFADGQVSAALLIPILYRAGYQLSRSFTVNLVSSSIGSVRPENSEVIITINDSDSPLSGQLSFSSENYSSNETSEGVAITVVRTGGADTSVDVQVIAVDGTAVKGIDYDWVDGTLIQFGVGEVSQAFVLPITARPGYQGDRSLNLFLFGASNGATLLEPYNCTVSILETSTPDYGVFEFSSPTYTAAEDSLAVDITIIRSGGSDLDVTVVLTYQDGTATALDYTPTTTQVTFLSGQTTRAIPILITDRAGYQGNRTMRVTIASVSNGLIGNNDSATVEILETTPIPYGTFEFASASYSGGENAVSLPVQLIRTGGNVGNVTLTLSITNQTAVSGVDFLPPADLEVQFGDGDVVAAFDLIPIERAGYQGDRVAQLTIASASNGSIGALSQTSLNILESSLPEYGEFNFSQAVYSVDDDLNLVEFEIARTSGADLAVSVTLAYSDGSAIAGIDYSAFPTQVEFLDKELFRTIQVPIIQRNNYQGDRSFSVSITSVSQGRIGSGDDAVVNIIEVAQPNYGVFELSSSAYAGDEESGSIPVVITRTGGTDLGVDVLITFTDGTAAAGTDYVGVAQTISFVNAQASAQVNIPVFARAGYQGDREFVVSIASVSNGVVGTMGQSQVMILESSLPSYGVFEFSSSTYSGDEDAVVIPLTVVRSGGSDLAVSLTLSFAPGTATSGVDYNGTSQQIDFLNGQASQIVNLPIINRANYQGDRALTATLSLPSNGSIGPQGSCSITILEVSPPPQYGTFQFLSSSQDVNEDAGTDTVTVSRVNGADGVVTVTGTLGTGTAIEGVDYTGSSFSVTFADGETTNTFSIPIIYRPGVHGTRFLTATIQSVSLGTIGGQNSTIVNILEVDTTGPVPSEATIGDLVYNWDFSDYSTITESGGAVSQVLDKVNGMGLTQFDSSLRPTYQPTGWRGGKPCIEFGLNQRIDTSVPFPAAAGPCTFFIVWRRISTNQAATSYFSTSNGNPPFVQALGGGTMNINLQLGPSGTNKSNSVTTVGATDLYLYTYFTFNGNAESPSITRGHYFGMSNPENTWGSAVLAGNNFFHEGLRLGSAVFKTNTYSIAQALIYAEVLSPQVMNELVQFLNNKWS